MEGDRGDKRVHFIFMDKFLALFYADRNSWGVPNEGQEYPDLIPKDIHHFLTSPMENTNLYMHI